jgi:leucyl/phenylalanyl-tRNA--protein transferase
MPDLTPELLLHGYSIGIFPMAETRDDPSVFWVDPRMRGVLPLDAFHISRSLGKSLRRSTFEVRIDTDFSAVVEACANRSETWINAKITSMYESLHALGQAHSLELWEGEILVGGVYGVTVGQAFFGESMFSRRKNASKMALAALIDRLREADFVLFDTQFITDHLASLGGIEITRKQYHYRLADAVKGRATFSAPPLRSLYDVMQRMTQIS